MKRNGVATRPKTSAAVSRLVRRSYLLSRCWSWVCRIEVEPRVRVPVPRLFTHRDP